MQICPSDQRSGFSVSGTLQESKNSYDPDLSKDGRKSYQTKPLHRKTSHLPTGWTAVFQCSQS